MPRIGVIGAGLAGVNLARALAGRAHVDVFEKSRGIGGRMATRYAGIFEFDHGAQYFTARTSAFQAALAPYMKAGQIAEWSGRMVTLQMGAPVTELVHEHPVYVATPRMNMLVKAMASGLDVHTNTRIEQVCDANGEWTLIDADGTRHGPYDWVISTAPAPQAAKLVPEGFRYQTAFGDVRMTGCFTLILGLPERPDLDWSGAKVQDNPLGWIAINSDKPGRETSPSVVIQTTNHWAEDHLEDDPDKIRDLMTDLFSELTGVSLQGHEHAALHRWRYAGTPSPLEEPFLMDTDKRFAVCGDWCLGGRVEAAFTSAHALAEALPL